MKLRSFGRRRSRALFGCLIGLLAIGGFAAATATPATSRTATTTTTSTAGPPSVLPGGTSLSIGITTPADGATVPAAPLTVQGTAEIGQAAPLPNTALIYVVDVSGSTQTLGTSTTCGNQNVYDTRAETTLDCELRAIKELNAAAIAAGTVGQIGMLAFGGASGAGQLTDAVQLDLNQSSGIQLFVSPAQHDASAFFGGTSDLEVVLKSAYVDPYVSAAAGWPAPGIDNGFTMFTTKNVYGNTNFWAAVKSVRDLATHTTLPNKLVAFISDGASTRGSPTNLGVSDALTGIAGIKIDTFAVGPDATCTGGSYGSLRDISNATGGTCTLLTDPADAADVVPGVIASHLNAINLRVDGAPALPATTTPVLPATGPATVSWSRTISGLAPGSHHLCGEAFASDGGGGGSAVDCIDVIVKAPPTITLSGGDDPVTGVAGEVPEGSSFAVGASVSDGATTWSSSGGTGDCAFADPSALSTSVTCDDDGLYALTLAADDGVNPPVSATEHRLVGPAGPDAARRSGDDRVAVRRSGHERHVHVRDRLGRSDHRRRHDRRRRVSGDAHIHVRRRVQCDRHGDGRRRRRGLGRRLARRRLAADDRVRRGRRRRRGGRRRHAGRDRRARGRRSDDAGAQLDGRSRRGRRRRRELRLRRATRRNYDRLVHRRRRVDADAHRGRRRQSARRRVGAADARERRADAVARRRRGRPHRHRDGNGRRRGLGRHARLHVRLERRRHDDCRGNVHGGAHVRAGSRVPHDRRDGD